MSYCRFRNTLGDLEDCRDHLEETKDLSEEEARARKRLIQACIEIAADYEHDET